MVVIAGVLGQSGVDVASLVTTSAVFAAILGLALQSTLTTGRAREHHRALGEKIRRLFNLG